MQNDELNFTPSPIAFNLDPQPSSSHKTFKQEIDEVYGEPRRYKNLPHQWVNNV